MYAESEIVTGCRNILAKCYVLISFGLSVILNTSYVYRPVIIVNENAFDIS